jgi:hypothetical protein
VIILAGTSTALVITIVTAPFEAALDSIASSIIRSIENFKVVEFGAAIVVCIMPTRFPTILIYRAIKNFSHTVFFNSKKFLKTG